MNIRPDLQPADLTRKIARLWEASAPKILSIDRDDKPGQSAPVFTIDGKYTARGWTEWTQGFAYGSALLQFDATGDEAFLKLGRERTFGRMAHHITHIGVHDHGFNNVSTYGNLLRLFDEGRLPGADRVNGNFTSSRSNARAPCRLRAGRRSPTAPGYIYSFNGPHSLFADTIRSLRALAMAHRLGHTLMGERDAQISLLGAPVRPRARHGEVRGVLRRGARLLRRARTRGARERFQHQQRRLPLPQLTTGLLPVHDVDARPGVDHVRLRRATGIPRRRSPPPTGRATNAPPSRR